MTAIIGTAYMDLDRFANDNALVMVPMWDGWNFLGYQPVKGNWKMPANYETFEG